MPSPSLDAPAKFKYRSSTSLRRIATLEVGWRDAKYKRRSGRSVPRSEPFFMTPTFKISHEQFFVSSPDSVGPDW